MRMESDSLGEKEVPDDAYYGIQTVRAMENFPISGYKLREELILALAMVKQACTVVNNQLGLLDGRIAAAIAAAAKEVLAGKHFRQFVVDPIQGGAGTSINMNINEVLANRAIELLGGVKGDYRLVSPNTHVNMSQSTNDVFPTAIRIAALKLGDSLVESLRNIIVILGKKAREFDRVVKVARTHLQDAIPIRLGQEFASYQHLIQRDKARLKNSLRQLLKVNIGATATGTGLNCHPDYAAMVVKKLGELSGYPLELARDLIDATQNIDTLAELSGAVKILALDLSKIANDLRLLSSGPRAGLNEINLPPVQPGSSIMPGKVNPVIPEVVNQVAFQVVGNDLTISMALEAGQLELNVMEPVVAHNLFESLSMLANAVNVFAEKGIKGIEANAEVCARYLHQSIGLITAINPYIGYEKAAVIAGELLGSNKTVKEMLLEKQVASAEEIDRLLSPYELTKGGIAGREMLKKFHRHP